MLKNKLKFSAKISCIVVRLETFQTILIEGITLGAGEKVDEVSGGVNGMGMDRIG
jgi:hypothetical protein